LNKNNCWTASNLKKKRIKTFLKHVQDKRVLGESKEKYKGGN
jgi:hypothetical protein